MSTNSYIISGKGFLKDVTFDREDKEYNFEWTQVLRQAKAFKSKAARQFIEKHRLEAFIWQPFSQEPVKNKWRVVRRERFYDFCNDKDHEVLEWKAQKVMMESKSDVRFLANSKNKNPETLYDSEEEAQAVAFEKNKAILEDLNKKMGLVQ